MEDQKTTEQQQETITIAMALVRSGWQMACDEILSWCAGRNVSPEFTDHLIEMMDERKKRQFEKHLYNPYPHTTQKKLFFKL